MPYGAAGIARPPEGVRRTPSETIATARDMLAAGRPFHAHDVFEDAWKTGPESERGLWRGLAQLAVGVTHAARGNRVGALALLRRGAEGIRPYAGTRPYGLDVAAILRWARDAEGLVAADGEATTVAPPPL